MKKTLLLFSVSCFSFLPAFAQSGIFYTESKADLMSVSPNPSEGIFTVSLDGKNTSKFIVYDVIVEYSPVTSTLQIDLSAESKGIYFLQIIMKENRLINKKNILSN